MFPPAKSSCRARIFLNSVYDTLFAVFGTAPGMALLESAPLDVAQLPVLSAALGGAAVRIGGRCPTAELLGAAVPAQRFAQVLRSRFADEEFEEVDVDVRAMQFNILEGVRYSAA